MKKGNKPLGFIEGEEFSDQLSKHQVSKQQPVLCS